MSKITRIMKEKILSQAGAGRNFFVMDSDESYAAELQNLFGAEVNVYNSDNSGIANAVSAAVAGRGDTIFVFPGSYTPDASIAISKEGLKVIGLSSDGKGADVSITGAAAADEIFAITADKVTVKGIRFNLDSAKDGIRIAESGVRFFVTIEDNRFIGGAIQIRQDDASDAPYLVIKNNIMRGASTSSIHVNATDAIVKGNIVSANAVATTALIEITEDGASIRPNQLVAENYVIGTGTAAAGIIVDAGTAGYVLVAKNIISDCTDDVSKGASSLVENYDEASGGTLLSA